MTDLRDSVADYCGSERFFFLDDDEKVHAEELLAYFCDQVEGALSNEAIQTGMEAVARLDVPIEARRAFPGLLKGYVEYLDGAGRLADAEDWTGFIDAASPSYVASFRQDGTVRGRTVRNSHTAVGRNDPCPCGSGKKFKKCCGR